jgi:hypothetical protein
LGLDKHRRKLGQPINNSTCIRTRQRKLLRRPGPRVNAADRSNARARGQLRCDDRTRRTTVSWKDRWGKMVLLLRGVSFSRLGHGVDDPDQMGGCNWTQERKAAIFNVRSQPCLKPPSLGRRPTTVRAQLSVDPRLLLLLVCVLARPSALVV